MDQDVRLVHFYFHGLGVRYEVRADVSAVELHTLYDVDGGVHTFGFADGDHAVLAYLAHGVSNEFAYLGVVVGGDRGYLLDLVEVVAYHFALLLDMSHYGADSFVYTALQIHRVSSCGYVLQSDANDGLCENGSSCCAVTGLVAGLRCNLLDELCAEVLGCVVEFDLFGYGHAVLGDMRSTVLLVENDVTSFRTKCYFYCVSQLVNAALQSLAGFCVVCDNL